MASTQTYTNFPMDKINGIFTSVTPLLHSIMDSFKNKSLLKLLPRLHGIGLWLGFSLNEPSTANIIYCE